ncbi:MAG: PspC domain-containing protein [Prevotellaceae bacterium]|jgi:phage shock protein PspC (stress-responsive transcriptional regulator)|nr:PspC domain-containing protein [Prevotellaceae bacterium]GHT34373.1 hypothetical protein FACS189434_10440 [Bacteroidia bacterium]
MEKKLTKSRNKMLSGVCAGFAEYFGWEVSVTRVAYAALTLFTAFSGVIIYIVAAIVMPKAE